MLVTKCDLCKREIKDRAEMVTTGIGLGAGYSFLCTLRETNRRSAQEAQASPDEEGLNRVELIIRKQSTLLEYISYTLGS